MADEGPLSSLMPRHGDLAEPPPVLWPLRHPAESREAGHVQACTNRACGFCVFPVPIPQSSCWSMMVAIAVPWAASGLAAASIPSGRFRRTGRSLEDAVARGSMKVGVQVPRCSTVPPARHFRPQSCSALGPGNRANLKVDTFELKLPAGSAASRFATARRTTRSACHTRIRYRGA